MKRSRLLCGTIAILLACVVLCPAQEADFGVRGGYQRFRAAGDGAVLGGLFFRKDWQRVVFWEAAILYHTEEVDDIDVELIPLQLSAMLFLLGRDEAICPYILGGAGVYMVRTTEPGDDSESEYDFGWHLGIGFDYTLTPKMFVEADVRYIWLDVDTGGGTVADAVSDFDNWMATVGFGFRL